MERGWIQRLANLRTLEARLQAACKLERYSDLETAGLIQTFEFTFELAWRTLKDLLAFVGVDANSPRDVIREAVAASLLADGATWLDALDRRHELASCYDERSLASMSAVKERYAPALHALVLTLIERTRTIA